MSLLDPVDACKPEKAQPAVVVPKELTQDDILKEVASTAAVSEAVAPKEGSMAAMKTSEKQSSMRESAGAGDDPFAGL